MANSIVTNHAFGIPTIRPLHDRVFVERLPITEKDRIVQMWPGGNVLYVPDIAVQNSSRARVIAVGDKVRDLKPGDLVLVPGAGNKYPDWEKYDYIMIQQGDIGGVFG